MTGSPIKPITGCGIVPTVRPRPSGWRQTRVLSELTETTWRRRSEPNGLFETCKKKCCQIVVGEKFMVIWVVEFLRQEYKSKLTYRLKRNYFVLRIDQNLTFKVNNQLEFF